MTAKNCALSVFTAVLFTATSLSVLAIPKQANEAPLAREKGVVALSIDNDFFAPTTADSDYTAGFALTHSGRAANKWPALDRLIGGIDSAIGINRHGVDETTYSLELGAYGFTPEDIQVAGVQADDRPYASLVYLSSSRAYPAIDNKGTWITSLSIGLLGLSAFESAQNSVHSRLGSAKAEGWDHQISAGGEPTFRYQIAYQKPWGRASPDRQFKTTYFGSVGYVTEAGIALSNRRGVITSPSYRFNPELITYGERANEALVTSSGGRESYFWGGVALKARAYNVFLQGQFRHSDHTLGAGDVRHLIAETWLGYTQSLGRRFKMSYVVRAQSSEIHGGEGDRSLRWGGLVISKQLQ